jgi:hypothetical protein
MRFFRPLPETTPRTVEPTPGEAYVQREFGDAIAFASEEWQRVEAADPSRGETFTLAQLLGAFLAGPICGRLDERFPAILAVGDEADALTERSGNARAIRHLIVGEAVIAGGGASRNEVRRALDWLA